MYCSQCGKQIPEDARFCMHCGASMSAEDTQVSGGRFWETCEILQKSGKGDKVHFYADAIGRSGKFVAGETATWKKFYGSGHRVVASAFTFGLISDGYDEYRELQEQKLEKLVAKLVKDGWQSSGDRGKEWWQLRFKRLV